jgi:hypothetical protein
MNAGVKVIYRNRRHNRHRHHMYNRRRNQGFAGQTANTLVGIILGGFAIRWAQKLLPANWSTGWMGAIGAAVIGVLGGGLLKRIPAMAQFGNGVMVGGLLVATIDIADQMSFQLPFMLSPGGTPVVTPSGGMGLLTSSNFFVPQVNLPGSMASFVAPAAIPAPVVVPAAGSKLSGLGYPGLRTVRRVGRMR